MAAERQVYFVGAFLPNEGETDQTIELAVLEWDLAGGDDMQGNNGSPLPHLYVHSFLAPRAPGRVRWGIVTEHGIEPSFIRKRMHSLPTIHDLIAEHYLQGKQCVIFDRSRDPIHALVQDASSVEEISSLWAEVFKNVEDEQARRASTLPEMLEYLGYPKVSEISEKSVHYTQLLLELFAMAAVWTVLNDFKRHPKKLRGLHGALPFNQVWPLDEAPEFPFEGDHDSLQSFSPREIDNFFSREMQDYVDWRRTNIYINDWVYHRESTDMQVYRALPDASDMAEYVFGKLFDLRMQVWILIFYSVFEHKTAYARDIAFNDGTFATLQPSVRLDFTTFVVCHLQDFLSPNQKQWLLRCIIKHFIEVRDRLPYEHYDFKALSRAQAQGSERFYFRQEPANSSIKCFSEIATRDHMVKYRRYEITGHGAEREQSTRWITELFRIFGDEVKNPFSNFWSVPEVHRWCQIIAGVEWQEIARAPRMNEPNRVTNMRALVSEVISNESRPYIMKLHKRLADDIMAINANPQGEFCDRFGFMGVSVEIVMSQRSQTSFFKRLIQVN